jgi:hypothetical protein
MKGGRKNSGRKNEPKQRPALSYEWDIERGKVTAAKTEPVRAKQSDHYALRGRSREIDRYGTSGRIRPRSPRWSRTKP